MNAFDGDRQAPGLIRFRFQWQFQSRTAFLLFGAAVLLFISYIVIALLAKDAYYAHRLATDGRVTAATVIKKAVHRASGDGTKSTSYEVDYGFSAADGRRVEGSDTVDPETWERIADGGPVDVHYSTSDPRINRIGTTTGVSMIVALSLMVASALGLLGATLAVMGLLALRASPESAVSAARGCTTVVGPPRLRFQVRVSPWIMIGGILLVCGVTFLLLDVLFLRQERLFHAEGMTATALVLTKSSHVVYDQQNRLLETKYDVGYRFTTQDGESVQGSDEISLHTWTSIRERDPIKIVYLLDRPARSRLLAADPSATSWIANVAGGALTVGGVLLLGYGMYGAMRRHRKNQR
jgi:hypothetical protein